MKKLFKEALLHFLLIGAALFGLQALLQPRQLEAPAALWGPTRPLSGPLR